MKKTKFNGNVQNITYKPDTCLNSGEYAISTATPWMAHEKECLNFCVIFEFCNYLNLLSTSISLRMCRLDMLCNEVVMSKKPTFSKTRRTWSLYVVDCRGASNWFLSSCPNKPQLNTLPSKAFLVWRFGDENTLLLCNSFGRFNW